MRARWWRLPADMYLRLERVDELLAALNAMRAGIAATEQRLAAHECRLEALAASIENRNELWRHTYALATAGSFEVQRRVLAVLRLLKPHAVQGFGKVRVGSPHDGGYVMVDDFAGIKAALSLGVEWNADWDLEIANRGIPVHQFDHTIDAPPVTHPDISFTKARIVAEPTLGGQTIDTLAEEHGGGVASLILKIDIEGDEWRVLDAVSESALSSFSQIVGEFHAFELMSDSAWQPVILRALEKIARQFGVVHIHANNYAGVSNIANVAVPHVLELAFANRSRYRLTDSDETFPGPLDSPNDPGLPDIYLGRR